MRNIWKVGALGAVFGAVLSVGGCQDFDAAYERCVSEGRCEPDGGTADGGDGGDGDGGRDSGPVDNPDCGPLVDAGVDYPDLTGQDLDCDGVDGVASAGFFVDPSDGNDENNGSQTQPVKTLERALQLIRDGGTGRTIVYLGTGTYNEAATVVDLPVSLYGGYTWQGHGRPYWERFKDGGGSTSFEGGPLAFTVRGVTDGGVLLEGLRIASGNATDAGEPSIALRILGTPEVRLRQVVLEAGLGAEGQAGAFGRPGTAGGKGEDGNSATNNSTSGGDSVLGGTGSCATSGDLSGGRSGNGISRGGGTPGFRGNPMARGGAGGDGGAGAALQCNTTTETCSCTGLPGFAGDKGADGDAGTGGQPGIAELGQLQLDAGTWVANALQHGEQGRSGAPGAGGGGGGSGGGCADIQVRNLDSAGSGAGGGGGAGGCSGEGGGGGMGGGASIALLLIDSNVVVEGSNQLTAMGGGSGGAGAMGGMGGDGGTGGARGQGTSIGFTPTDGGYRTTTFGGNGGVGGAGGRGGPGGWGGGGAGGPTVNVWCENAGITLDAGTLSLPARPGGAGGQSEAGREGAPGLSRVVVGCTIPEGGTTP